jgi:hypothetical protein
LNGLPEEEFFAKSPNKSCWPIMKISQIEPREKYLFVKLEGLFGLQKALFLFKQIEEESTRLKLPLVMFDFRDVTGEVNILARYKMAEDLARWLRRVAMIARPDQVDRKRFMQTVAHNRGMIGMPFLAVSEGETWLLSGTDNIWPDSGPSPDPASAG